VELLSRVICCVFGAAILAPAANFDYTALITSASPTFNRPNDNGNNPPNSLSGEIRPYTVFGFQVSSTGNYSLRSQAPSNTWNNFLVLYQGTFNQGAPLTNAIGVNDNNGGNYWNSRIDANLTAGMNYYLVTTAIGFLPGSGPWSASNRIITPGSASIIPSNAVPEPSSALLLASAIGVLLLARRVISLPPCNASSPGSRLFLASRFSPRRPSR
jgi:hypothetical protein